MAVPEDHKRYLSLKFVTEVDLTPYPQADREFLERYGAWLNALMIRKIEPTTSAQHDFLEFCWGRRHPATDAEKLWKRHQLDLMFIIAKECEYHAGSRFTLIEIERRFEKLAIQGHTEALRRKETASIRPVIPPPLINIAEIYPLKLRGNDVMTSGLMVSGSYGSRQ